MRKSLPLFTAISICFAFFITYTILAIVKHLHFQSGYDLSIADQIVWKYSQLKAPITTIQSFYNTSLLSDHVEIIYILLAPFYWIANTVITLLTLQTAFITSSGIAIFLIARGRKLSTLISLALLISYLLFYGIQQAIWSDVHSLVFGVSLLAWFVYFLERKQNFLTILFLLLALSCKEDIALLTSVIGIVYAIATRRKITVIIVGLSFLYLFIIFFIYFPHFTRDGYRYMNNTTLLTGINLLHFIDTKEKQQVFLYSFGWFGFLPLLSPLFSLIAIADLGHYFLLGNSTVVAAQGLFLHYRSSLGLFLVLPTIIVLSKWKRLNTWPIAIYILVCAIFLQYFLHLPLSYLTKKWFWTTPQSVASIKNVISSLPKDTSLVTQINILPHLSHRDELFTLWPTKKDFPRGLSCQKACDWFSFGGNPRYLLVDLSTDWDIRHVLTTHDEFVKGIENLEHAKVITPVKVIGTTRLYKIIGKI